MCVYVREFQFALEQFLKNTDWFFPADLRTKNCSSVATDRASDQSARIWRQQKQ